MTDPVEQLSVDDFLHEMEGIRSQAAKSILSGAYGRPPLGQGQDIEAIRRPEVIFLIQLGVYPEWRESHLLARQIQRIDDYQLLRRVGQQIADEAKHAAVLCQQLTDWGADPKRFYLEPIYEWSASFDYMDKLIHPAEYFAVSNFIGEGLFLPTLLAPMAKHDRETFAVYVEHILPDEPAHVRLGRDFIFKYCKTGTMQQRVRQHAKVVAKQYCLGYKAAIDYASQAAAGQDPVRIRDAGHYSPPTSDNAEIVQIYESLVKEFQI